MPPSSVLTGFNPRSAPTASISNASTVDIAAIPFVTTVPLGTGNGRSHSDAAIASATTNPVFAAPAVIGGTSVSLPPAPVTATTSPVATASTVLTPASPSAPSAPSAPTSIAPISSVVGGSLGTAVEPIVNPSEPTVDNATRAQQMLANLRMQNPEIAMMNYGVIGGLVVVGSTIIYGIYKMLTPSKKPAKYGTKYKK